MDDATIHERIEQLVDEEHAAVAPRDRGRHERRDAAAPARAADRSRPDVGSAPAAQGAEAGASSTPTPRRYETRTSSRTTGSRRPAVILDNGVIRTLDPSLPTCGALAIAGPFVAGGVGTHEWLLPTPERVDLARPLRPARLHRLARPLPDLGARPARRSPRGGRLGRGGARARGGASPRRRHLDPRDGMA